ncbi:hypothetical protein QUV68_22405, partial [Xanthomonas citri pv. citri]
VVATRSLSRKFEAIELLKEVLNDTIFTEYARMEELLTQKQMGWQSRLANAGHAYAMQTASRNTSKIARLEYVRGGLPALNSLTEFLQQAEQDNSAWQKLGERLAILHSYIKALPKQALIIAEAEILPTLQQAISESWQAPVDKPAATLIESPITTDGS